MIILPEVRRRKGTKLPRLFDLMHDKDTKLFYFTFTLVVYRTILRKGFAYFKVVHVIIITVGLLDRDSYILYLDLIDRRGRCKTNHDPLYTWTTERGRRLAPERLSNK